MPLACYLHSYNRWNLSIQFYSAFLFHLDNRLFDTNYELQNLNLKLSVENEQLRSGGHSSNNGSGAVAAAKISQLENKLLTQQEELTALHKRKGENSQMIVDLSLKLDKQNKVLTEKDARLLSSTCDFILIQF